MKRVLAILFVLCLTGAVQADVFFTVDEDMEGGEGWMNVFETDGTSYLWGSAWGNADLRANSTGTTDDGDYQVLLQANTNTYDDNPLDPYWVDQTTLLGNKSMEANYYAEVDDLDGQTITFLYEVLSNDLAAAGYRTQAFIKVLDAGGGWATTQEVYLDLNVGVGSLTLEVTTGSDPRVQAGFVVKGLNVAGASVEAALGVTVVAYRANVTNPDPADGIDVPINLATLSWLNRNPIVPDSSVSCSVYLEAEGSDASGTNPTNIDPNFAAGPIATGITDGTVDISGITLEDDMWYSWRVYSSEPNLAGGGPIVTEGDLWTFHIGDVPPTVTAGDNHYLWLDMEDGDGDSAKVTFNLTGTYTDDGKSEITTAQWVQGAHEGGGTVTIESQNWDAGTNTVTAEVTATGNGWLFLSLELTDASGTGTDELNVGVYGTCIEAANEDPADVMYQSYAHGDIDGDCDTDLNDLAIMAGTWGDCMTTKAGCVP